MNEHTHQNNPAKVRCIEWTDRDLLLLHELLKLKDQARTDCAFEREVLLKKQIAELKAVYGE